LFRLQSITKGMACLPLLLFAVTVFGLTSCERLDPIILTATNRTNETLTIFTKLDFRITQSYYKQEHEIGIIKPGETWTKGVGAYISDTNSLTIYAKNDNGIIVYSEEFTIDQYVIDSSESITFTPSTTI
jgi:hypothetical protein